MLEEVTRSIDIAFALCDLTRFNVHMEVHYINSDPHSKAMMH